MAAGDQATTETPPKKRTRGKARKKPYKHVSKTTGVHIAGITIESVISLRKVLFRNGLSLQEFLSHIIALADHNPDIIQRIIESAKTLRGYNTKYQNNLTTVRLYDILENNSPIVRNGVNYEEEQPEELVTEFPEDD